MNINKANNRDRKINKRKYGMLIDNRNIFILEEEQKKRSLQIKKERKNKLEREN
jgi:hypothetical protein